MEPSILARRPLALENNRISRSYIGGTLLNKWKGLPAGEESCMCEEWQMSVVEVQNIDSKPYDGLSKIRLKDGAEIALRDLIAMAPTAFLGKKYVEAVGDSCGMGIRTGDSVVRLSLQAHPRPADAKKYLNFSRGKTEAWYIVETREIGGGHPYVRIGLKPGVTKQKMREMFFAEDVRGIEESMHKIPIEKGDVILVPSGTPHAMGPGAMFLEVAEACDFTFKLEHVMPTRRLDDREMHYGIGFDNMLECIDYSTSTEQEIRKKVLLRPVLTEKTEAAEIFSLIGYGDTPCFTMNKAVVHGNYTMRSSGIYRAAVAIDGSGIVTAADGFKTVFKQGSGIFLPADFGELTFSGDFVFLFSDGEKEGNPNV
ncbi:MAG: hypothetical protein VB021_01835 [Oscillospiraceae bacterium]|nr:hypothetical protein [Oscillospiraceae bacterium]